MKQKIFKIITLSFLVAFVSCDSYLDINETPNSPTKGDITKLLPVAQTELSNTLSMGSAGLSSTLSTFMHQTVQFRKSAFYEVAENDFVVSQSWTYFYIWMIAPLDEVIVVANEKDYPTYRGIAKVMKGYVYSKLADTWVSAPTANANLGSANLTPDFTSGDKMYEEAIKLVNEGLVDLTTAVKEGQDSETPGSFDLYYGGNRANWAKLASSILLELYNNIRLVQNNSEAIKKLIADGNLIDASSAWELEYGKKASPENRNPGYVNEYNSERMEFYISPWFYNIMKGTEESSDEGKKFNLKNPFGGIEDPRIPYYFFNQVTAANADDVAAIEYRHPNTKQFISILFGGTGDNHGAQKNGEGTVPGLYPFGGRYDDGKGEDTEAKSGPGNVPFRLLSYHKSLFTRAELAHQGISGEDAKTLLTQAINAAFASVNSVVTKYGGEAENKQEVPVIAQATIDAYRDAVIAKYDAADNNGKLQIIMTQKWISTFGNSVDQYNDYRRTGYPLLHDTKTDAEELKTIVPREFPLSFPYPDIEINSNSKTPKQIIPATAPVFWDK